MNQFMLALCAWRENRHGQTAGMQSVINVVMNRVSKNGSSAYVEIIRPLQFSSITLPGNAELNLFPQATDPQWLEAQSLAAQALGSGLADITGGATSYYALSLSSPPWWAASMVKTVVVAGQQFMKVVNAA